MSDAATQISELSRTIESNNKRIRDLGQQYDSLYDFSREVRRQREEFEGKVRHRANLASRMAQLANVHVAQVLASRTREYTCTTMSSGVEECFSAALEEVSSALFEVEREVERLHDENRSLAEQIRMLQDRVRAEQG